MAGDQNWYSKVLGLHCDGTNGSTTITDVKGKTATRFGNTQISTAQYPPLTGKTSSLYFDGTGDYLTYANSSYSVAMSEILAAISSAVAVIFGTLPAKFVIRAFASADRVRAMTKTELIRAKVDANVAVVKTADIRIVCLDTPASVRASADAPLVRGKP